jgi:hypothetical protein
VGGTQIAWIRQILESDQSALSVAADPVAIDSYLECLVRYFFCVPTVFGLGGGIFGLIALFISRRLLIQFPTHRLCCGRRPSPRGGLLVCRRWPRVKNTFDPDYLFPLVVFFGRFWWFFFFRRLEERAAETGDSMVVRFGRRLFHAQRDDLWRNGILPMPSESVHRPIDLTDQQQVARRLTAHLLEHDCGETCACSSWFMMSETAGCNCAPAIRLPIALSVSISHRDSARIWKPAVRKQPCTCRCCRFSRRQRVSELKPPPVATRFDQFTTERLFVSLYWSDVNDNFLSPPHR